MSFHDGHSLGKRSLKSLPGLAQPFIKEDTKGIREEGEDSPLQEKRKVGGSERLSPGERRPKAQMTIGTTAVLGAS